MMMIKNLTRFVLFTITFTVLVSSNTYAAEDVKADKPAAEETSKTADAKPQTPAGLYAPDFCDFEITFPEKPATIKKCVPGVECYDLQSYTMVFGLQTTVDVSANCTPSTPENYKRYTQTVMKAALAGMVDDQSLKDYDISFNEDKEFRSGALTGSGTKGASGMIYTGQLWVGPNSFFTLQAELIGNADKVADEQFTDILKSIKYKGGKQLPTPPKPIQKSQPKNQ